MKKIILILLIVVMMSTMLCGCFGYNKMIEKVFDESDKKNRSAVNIENYNIGNAEMEADGIDDIDIEWASGKVTVVQGTDDKITLTETCTDELDDESAMYWYVENNRLYVFFNIGNPAFNFSESKELTVSLPEGFNGKKLLVSGASADIYVAPLSVLRTDISSGSGDAICEAVSKEMYLSTTSGEVSVNCSAPIDKLDVSTASGSINVNVGDVREFDAVAASGYIEICMNSVIELEAATSSGKIKLDTGSFGEAEIETSSGTVDVVLPYDCDFKVDIDTSSGVFTSDFAYAMHDGEYVCGKGKSELYIETSSGNINIFGK